MREHQETRIKPQCDGDGPQPHHRCHPEGMPVILGASVDRRKDAPPTHGWFCGRAPNSAGPRVLLHDFGFYAAPVSFVGYVNPRWFDTRHRPACFSGAPIRLTPSPYRQRWCSSTAFWIESRATTSMTSTTRRSGVACCRRWAICGVSYDRSFAHRATGRPRALHSLHPGWPSVLLAPATHRSRQRASWPAHGRDVAGLAGRRRCPKSKEHKDIHGTWRHADPTTSVPAAHETPRRGQSD